MIKANDFLAKTNFNKIRFNLKGQSSDMKSFLNSIKTILQSTMYLKIYFFGNSDNMIGSTLKRHLNFALSLTLLN